MCLKPQQAEKNTVSVNGFKQFDVTSVADQKNSLLQYHENIIVITGTKTVTMHLVTHGCSFSGDNNYAVS